MERAVLGDDAQGCQCPFVLCLHPQGYGAETLQALLAFGILEDFPMSGGWGDGREGLWAVVELSGMPGCIRNFK